jgi:multidrug efflux system membrane fusion protein
VEKVLFQEGSEVKEGDPLFELNKRPYEEKLAAAKGALAEAKAALNQSTLQVPRLTALVRNRPQPRRTSTPPWHEEVGQAECTSAEAQVKSTELDIGYCDVKAPIAGRIGAKEVSIGSLVGKGEPTLLATISQVDPIWFLLLHQRGGFSASGSSCQEAGGRWANCP